MSEVEVPEMEERAEEEEDKKREKELKRMKKLIKKLEEQVTSLGLSKEEFKEILEREQIPPYIRRVESFIKEHEEDLKEIAELKARFRKLSDIAFEDELRELMQREGIEDYIPVDKEERSRIKAFIESFEPPYCKISLNGELLRRIVNAITQCTPETRLVVNEEGIETRAVDASNIMMVDLSVKRWNFLTFKRNMDRVLGVDWDAISAFTKFMKPNNLVEMEFTRELKIEIVGTGDDPTRRTVRIPLLEPSQVRKTPNVPSFDLEAETMVGNFRSIIAIHESIGDCMTIEIKNGETSFKTMSRDGEGEIEDRFDVGSGKGKSSYSVEYLKCIAKGLGNNVRIELSDDYPAIFTAEEDGITIKYILAPRIEVE